MVKLGWKKGDPTHARDQMLIAMLISGPNKSMDVSSIKASNAGNDAFSKEGLVIYPLAWSSA